MIDRSYLEEVIEKHFPDLKNTGFSYNDALTPAFSEQKLLPYLAYQNTIDVRHRLIGLYLPERCSSNLIPIYIIMGQYRKALDKIMAQAQFKNQAFENGKKQVVYNGSVCCITAIDYLNRQLVFRSGTGLVTTMPFAEKYRLSWPYKNAEDIKKQVSQFVSNYQAANGNIFSFPLAPADKHYEGVILFTNTSKFESLIRNVKVSGADLRDHINIKKVVFPVIGEDIRFVSLSRTKAEKKPVSLLIARHDSFRAYEAIIEAGRGKLDHIKTIVIDDFDELVNRWERSDSHREEIMWLRDNYFQRVASRHLQNLYLLSRNSKILIHELFREMGIDYYPWLLRPLEEASVDQDFDAFSHPVIIVTKPVDEQFENLNCQLNTLIDRWKILAEQNYCNGDILNPVSSLFELRKKLNSYFNPTTLKDWTSSLLSTIDTLHKKWFTGGQDYHVIEETKKFAEAFLKEPATFTNFKLQLILDELKQKNITGEVSIVSDNSSSDDGKWLAEFIESKIPAVKVNCIYKSDFFMPRQSSCESAATTLIIYLSCDKKLLALAAGNLLAIQQLFILNKRVCSFAEGFLRKFQKLQLDAGEDKLKYDLLNIRFPPKMMKADDPGLIPLQFNRQQTIASPETEGVLLEERGLQQTIVDILEKRQQRTSAENPENYMLFFHDGTLTETQGSRHFFLYEDDKEYNDLDNIFSAAADLKAGDQIIMASRGVAVRDLMDQALRKNSAYAHALETDEKWRLLLRNHISRSGLDPDFISWQLAGEGFNIGPAAVKNWIDGETRRPGRFPILLKTLHQLGIIPEDEITEFDRCNADLKSMQIKFIRTAIPRLIARLQGIGFGEDEIFTDDLLNDFIHHIEIKRISAIYKI
ncbi:hypothetical protein GCM10027592_03540 [Spirosoma flavus]